MGLMGDIGKTLAIGVLDGIQEGLNIAQDNIQKAQRRQEQQNILAELKAFEQKESGAVRAAENGDIEAIQYLMMMYHTKGDYQKSMYWGSQGVAVNNSMCLYFMGMMAFQDKEYDIAENLLRRDIDINGNELSAEGLGNMYLSLDNVEAAEPYFEFAVSRNPSNTESSLGLAVCMLNQGSRDFPRLKQLLQVACRSNNYSTRDAAQKILQQVNEDERNQQNQNCFITTAVCDNFGKPDDCYELTAFRKFRDGWLKMQSDGQKLIEEYYKTAPSIVAKINSLPNAKIIYSEIWDKYLSKCLSYIESRDYTACKKLYVKMVENLKAKFNA